MNRSASRHSATPFRKQILSIIDNALSEDIGSGDHTTLASIPASANASAVLKVKENGIISGVALAELIFKRVDPKLKVRVYIKDGRKVSKGDIAFKVSGPARSILTAERVVLNCMQRMSGIATRTQLLNKKLKGSKTKILDTRKTTPGFRAIEKWAVKIGGGFNHRFGLYDMILIKNNHIDYAGGISNAVSKTLTYLKNKRLNLKIEVEARSIKEVEQIIRFKEVSRILLDNFSPALAKKAIALIPSRYEVELSGGITLKNIGKYAKCGADFISVGALTHSSPGLDLSLTAVS